MALGWEAEARSIGHVKDLELLPQYTGVLVIFDV